MSINELDPQAWQAMSTHPLAYVLAGVLGALWGSFGNVCIYRMPPTDAHPRGRSVVKPGSHCSACQHPVRWYDNVPLLSYLWLRGRCRDCQTQFSPRYLLVEGAAALLFVAAYHYSVVIVGAEAKPSDALLHAAVLCAFLWTLLIITFIDLDHMLILDKVTYPAIPIFYGLGLLLGREYSEGLIGIAVGYGLIRLISDGYWLLTKREGMGYGDGKLLAIIGALYGWQGVFVSLFLGSILGSVITISLLLVAKARGGNASDETSGGAEGDESDEEAGVAHLAVPFGPFLSMAAVIHAFAESYLQLRFSPLW